jgi:mannitol-1-phosphate/altronate dehydrogenase
MDINERRTAPRKLSPATLTAFAGRVAVPTYDRKRLAPAIVHIGVGGFHRTHQAVYLDDLAARDITLDWGEHGVGLLPADKPMAAALIPQDCLYTVVTRGATGDTARVIGSMTGYLFAPDDRARVLDVLADPATRMVSLTITEGGYNIDSHTGQFNADHPAIQADVHNPDMPSSVFGYLCAALDRRRRTGDAPFTVVSCDNLQGNGQGEQSVGPTLVQRFGEGRQEELRHPI